MSKDVTLVLELNVGDASLPLPFLRSGSEFELRRFLPWLCVVVVSSRRPSGRCCCCFFG